MTILFKVRFVIIFTAAQLRFMWKKSWSLFDIQGSVQISKWHIIVSYNYTLIDPNSRYLRPLLKTTPAPQRYPWVPGGQEVTNKPRFRGFVLSHLV